MSLNDFNERVRLDIEIYIEGSGQFSPFADSYGIPMNWNLGGTVKPKEFTGGITTRQAVCGVPINSSTEFRYTAMPGSTGNTSGFINLGQFTEQLSAETLVGRPLGTWKVNTKPVLSENANADDEPVLSGYYVVEVAENKTVDDPILINPEIDNLKKVYPGDLVYVSGSGTNAKWQTSPKQRFPKSDRTFFWTPNTSPKLESGGIAAGKLVKPGTIMLPTANHYIEPPTAAIDGQRYFWKDQGLMFNGYTWVKNMEDPYIYEPEEGPKEFWPQNVQFVPSQIYERRLENEHRTKPFVLTNQTIDDETPVTFMVTTEEGDVESTDLLFRWQAPMNGAETNIQPGIFGFIDFGDAWSKHHLATQTWLKTKFPGFYSAGFVLQNLTIEPPMTLVLGVEDFSNGNITEITETITTMEGDELTNNFKVTLSVVAYLQ